MKFFKHNIFFVGISKLLFCVFLIYVFCFINIKIVIASVISQITATPSDVTIGATTSYTMRFRNYATMDNAGKIIIEFPSGFDISGATFVSWDGFDGGQTSSISGQVITITRDGTGTSSVGGVKKIVLDNIVNNSIASNTYQSIITTKNNLDAVLDGPTSSVYFQLFASNTETDIDGIYYFRDDLQSHFQGLGSDAGAKTSYVSDTGSLLRTPPTSDENRYCGGWINFYFDENGTYTQTNTINNIYYHIWWDGTSTNTFGYNLTGTNDSATFTESYTLPDPATAVNRAPNGSLYSSKQTFASPQSIEGNAIYNLFIKLKTSYPIITSSPNQNSFIIINLPDDETLQGLDTDSDGISDYDELFVYNTNSYKADTDGDGWNDKYEIDNNLNPLDHDEAPSLEYLIKQFDSVAPNDGFGSSITHVSDIDGDDKEEVVIGVSGADPDGKANAGSVYIYSSGSGELIRQFNGITAGDYFGKSVASIDIDGDGKKESLLIGASAHMSKGAVYMYSPLDGTLLKKYSGLNANGQFGSNVAVIGDQDNDGLEDLIIGESATRTVYIYSSSDSNEPIKQSTVTFSSICLGCSIYSVDSISDVDGDGKDDVLSGFSTVGFFLANNTGHVYIHSSGSGEIIRSLDATVKGNGFGSVVGSIDLDGDGKKESLLVSSPYYSTAGEKKVGAVYLYSPDGTLIRRYSKGADMSYFGSSIGVINDKDGDGIEDLVIGSSGFNGNAIKRSGIVYIYSSVSGSLIEQYDGYVIDHFLGSSVVTISDVDGDGEEDFIAGAGGGDPANYGSVYLYSTAGIPAQTLTKGGVLNDTFDLDDYFSDSNNLTVPERNQTMTFTASTADNPFIDVSIGAGNIVSFSSPSTEWAGTETVVFTATDSTNLSSNSNAVKLTVSGSPMNVPTIGAPTVDSSTSITWSWTDNSEIEDSYRVYYVNTGGNTATNAVDLSLQAGTSSSGSILSWTDDDLQPNTQYSIQVKAYKSGAGESTASEISLARYTLANTPLSISLSDRIVSWSANSNPSGTYFYAENITDNTNSGWITDTSWTIPALTCGETYSFRVKAKNGDDIETDYFLSENIQTPSCAIIPGQFVRTPVTTNPTVSSLQSKIAELKALIASLTNKTPSSSSFTTNLSFGSRGNDVRQLQIFLNIHGYPVSTTGPGSPGNETTIFGYATKAALIRFQKANNIDPIGVFGPMTRGVVNGWGR